MLFPSHITHIHTGGPNALLFLFQPKEPPKGAQPVSSQLHTESCVTDSWGLSFPLCKQGSENSIHYIRFS